MKTIKTHITEMPTLSAVVAPFVTCDITFPTFPERKQSFRFPVLKYRISFVVGNIFIQPPDRGTLLLSDKAVNNSSFSTVEIVRLCYGWSIRNDHSRHTA